MRILTTWRDAGNRVNELTCPANLATVVNTIIIRIDTTTTLSKTAVEVKYLLAVAHVFESKGKHVESLTHPSHPSRLHQK